MKISYKGDYALKIILDLAIAHDLNPDTLVQIKDISSRQDIPGKFLEQIITMLKSGGYVKTVRGPKGGVQLSRTPSEITIGEVIRLMEGPTSPITCVSRSAYVRCTYEAKCVFRDMWEDIRNKINNVVDNTTFQDMVQKVKKLQNNRVIDYTI